VSFYLFGFLDNFHSAHLYTPYIVSKLQDTLMSTIEGYGCDIWGPGAVHAALESSGEINTFWTFPIIHPCA
jgi:hypothetical protein